MDCHRDIAGQRGHLDGQNAFGNQFTGPSADNSHAQHALGLRIDEQLSHSLGTVQCDGTAGCAPGKLRHFDLAIFFFRLSLG